jgi:hypothetical protein
MTLSPFDRRLLTEGPEYFSRPRLASVLEMLGTSDRERLDVLVTMLRHAPAVEFEAAVDLFERATERAARQRAWDGVAVRRAARPAARVDPVTGVAVIAIMRKMATLSLDDIARGFDNFANPSARGLLESLGRTREEQVDALAGMLRNSSDEDIAELGQIFGEAMARLDRARCRRDFSSAEWRRERRRHS